jgi:hypothetical protein
LAVVAVGEEAAAAVLAAAAAAAVDFTEVARRSVVEPVLPRVVSVAGVV